MFTYSALGEIDLADLRLFSYNTDNRSEQNYDVEFSIDNGTSFSSLIANVTGGSFGESVLTSITDNAGGLLASGVTDVNFVFGTTITSPFRSSALVEIDAFSEVQAVPLPAALPLFGTGLGILGFIGWRRRRKAAAAV